MQVHREDGFGVPTERSVNMEEYAFKGVFIPKEIWLHPDLDAKDKIIWAAINVVGTTYTSVAKFAGCSPNTVKRIERKLISLGLI